MSKVIFAALFFVGCWALSSTSPISALSGSQFKPGRIVDDSIFFNPNGMSAASIQSFLNKHVYDPVTQKYGICDTYGVQPHAGTTRKIYSARKGVSTPFRCLKDYRQNIPNKSADEGLCKAITAASSRPAAEIIYKIGKACGVNQKVLIVLLEKEQSLVSDAWPWPIQYRSATGYGCPDTAACDTRYYGFFNQVYNAARQFKYYAKYSDSFNHIAGRNNYILYNPNAACGGKNVFIQNQATAGLYNYTPYQPNAAALKNLYGSGDSCSAYGNRNFWRLFNGWFGSTISGPSYRWSLVSRQAFTNSARTQPFTKWNPALQPGQYAYLRVKVKNTGQIDWTNDIVRLGVKQYSPLTDSSWYRPNRPAKLIESRVRPGGVGTFEFRVKAPGSLNSYIQNFQLLAEGKAWMKGNVTYFINTTKTSPLLNTKNKLISGGTLNLGRNLISRDKHNVLLLHQSGDLQLYSAGKMIWHTNTDGRNGDRLIMQGDGNLVLYNRINKPIWNTATFGSDSRLVLQSDGNVVLYNGSTAKFSTDTKENPQLQVYVSPTLPTNFRLYPNQQLQTPDRRYHLLMQPDGNLVLYSPTRATWASRTSGKNIAYATLNNKGNLLLIGKNGQIVWRSSAQNYGSSYLHLRQDGNLIVYKTTGKAVWNTGTSR